MLTRTLLIGEGVVIINESSRTSQHGVRIRNLSLGGDETSTSFQARMRAVYVLNARAFTGISECMSKHWSFHNQEIGRGEALVWGLSWVGYNK